MIVWVASYPRSGNRLSRATLAQVFGQRVGSAASDAALRRDLSELLDQLGVGADDDPLPPLRELDESVFLKTHSLLEDVHTLPEIKKKQREDKEKSPAIYLVRDGRDAVVSLAHYFREHNPRLKPMSYEGAIWDLTWRPHPYGGWSGNVGAWRRRTAHTEIVRFEELIEDAAEALGSAAKALGLDLPEPRGEPPSFEELKARSPNPNLLRRGKAGSWRTEFPPDMLDEFWRRHGEQMEALGYSRE